MSDASVIGFSFEQWRELWIERTLREIKADPADIKWKIEKCVDAVVQRARLEERDRLAVSNG